MTRPNCNCQCLNVGDQTENSSGDWTLTGVCGEVSCVTGTCWRNPPPPLAPACSGYLLCTRLLQQHSQAAAVLLVVGDQLSQCGKGDLI